MPEDDKMFDVHYCLITQREYFAKGQVAKDTKLKAAYEAIAGEFARRARDLVARRSDNGEGRR